MIIKRCKISSEKKSQRKSQYIFVGGVFHQEYCIRLETCPSYWYLIKLVTGNVAPPMCVAYRSFIFFLKYTKVE